MQNVCILIMVVLIDHVSDSLYLILQAIQQFMQTQYALSKLITVGSNIRICL